MNIENHHKPAPAGAIVLGGYTNYGAASSEASFITEIGGNPANSVLMDFLNMNSWEECWATTGGFGTFAAWAGPKCLALPLCVKTNPLGWNDIIGGSQDASLKTFAQWCHVAGVSIIRPGWEFNGSWFPWGVGGKDTAANQAGFIGAWQHVWNIFNGVAPGYFQFLWNPTIGKDANMSDLFTNYMPPLNQVQAVGLDVYDNNWGPVVSDSVMWSLITGAHPNLLDLVTFAVAHDKIIALPEWACWPLSTTPSSTDGAGDDPGFVNNVTAWVTSQAQNGRTVWCWPWNNGTCTWSNYPRSLAALTAWVTSSKVNQLIK